MLMTCSFTIGFLIGKICNKDVINVHIHNYLDDVDESIFPVYENENIVHDNDEINI